jgi:hypothetical protein
MPTVRTVGFFWVLGLRLKPRSGNEALRRRVGWGRRPCSTCCWATVGFVT